MQSLVFVKENTNKLDQRHQDEVWDWWGGGKAPVHISQHAPELTNTVDVSALYKKKNKNKKRIYLVQLTNKSMEGNAEEGGGNEWVEEKREREGVKEKHSWSHADALLRWENDKRVIFQEKGALVIGVWVLKLAWLQISNKGRPADGVSCCLMLHKWLFVHSRSNIGKCLWELMKKHVSA